MPALTVLRFSVRSDAETSLETIGEEVSAAIGFELHEGSYHLIPALRGRILGMEVGLFRWGKEVFRIVGEVEDPKFLASPDGTLPEISAMDISQPMADLLTTFTSFSWRVPDSADIRADQRWGRDVEDRFSEDL